MASEKKELKKVTDITEVFQKAGISLKVTSNDLIDLIVAEKWKEIMSQYQGLKKDYDSLKKKYENEFKKQFEKQIKEIKTGIQGEESFVFEKYQHNREVPRYFSLYVISMNYSTSSIKLERSAFNMPIVERAYVKFTGKIGVFEIEGKSTERVQMDMPGKLIEELEKYNEKAKEFFNSYDQLSLSKLRSAMKAELSRKVIENTPVEFKKQLAESFNVVI